MFPAHTWLRQTLPGSRTDQSLWNHLLPRRSPLLSQQRSQSRVLRSVQRPDWLLGSDMIVIHQTLSVKRHFWRLSGGCADANSCTGFPYCRGSDLLRDLVCVANLISFSSQMSSSSSSKGWILSLEQASNAAVLACKSQAGKFNERTSIFMMQHNNSGYETCPST